MHDRRHALLDVQQLDGGSPAARRDLVATFPEHPLEPAHHVPHRGLRLGSVIRRREREPEALQHELCPETGPRDPERHLPRRTLDDLALKPDRRPSNRRSFLASAHGDQISNARAARAEPVLE